MEFAGQGVRRRVRIAILREISRTRHLESSQSWPDIPRRSIRLIGGCSLSFRLPVRYFHAASEYRRAGHLITKNTQLLYEGTTEHVVNALTKEFCLIERIPLRFLTSKLNHPIIRSYFGKEPRTIMSIRFLGNCYL